MWSLKEVECLGANAMIERCLNRKCLSCEWSVVISQRLRCNFGDRLELGEKKMAEMKEPKIKRQLELQELDRIKRILEELKGE